MAHIRLNEERWNSLSDEQQSEIIRIMRESGLMREEDEIIPDPDTPFVSEPPEPKVSAGIDPCIRVCIELEASLRHGCRIYDDILMRAACMDAAYQLGRECRNGCKDQQ